MDGSTFGELGGGSAPGLPGGGSAPGGLGGGSPPAGPRGGGGAERWHCPLFQCRQTVPGGS